LIALPAFDQHEAGKHKYEKQYEPLGIHDLLLGIGQMYNHTGVMLTSAPPRRGSAHLPTGATSATSAATTKARAKFIQQPLQLLAQYAIALAAQIIF
jgi:hypothetical protein